MEIKQDLFVHNRFDIEVVDAKTGKVKQTAVGFNVITDRYFSMMLTSYPDREPFYYITFGSGTGTPAATDTALFKTIGSIEPDITETVYEYPTSHITRQIKLDADSYNDKTITEVGFIGRVDNNYTFSNYLITHAMLQDSEGNPIAIQKTNTDIVYINATFYCTYTPGGFGDNGVYPRPENNTLVQWVFGLTWTDASSVSPDTLFRLRCFPHRLPYSDDLQRRYTTSKLYYTWYSSSTPAGVPDIENKTLTLKDMSFLDTDAADQTIGTLGIDGLGAFVFPDPSVLPGYSVSNTTVGTGDGTTTDFSLGAPYVKRGTVKIYVDDVEKTEGTDYTVDYESNCTNCLANYPSAALSLYKTPEQVKFGNFESQTPYEKTGYYDPLSTEYPYKTYKFYPTSVKVTQATPIWLDFLTAKACNRLVITKITLPSGDEDKMVIEYSDDNENWTAVTYARDAQIYSWDEVSARYWRVYLSGTSWTYSLFGSGQIDTSVRTSASFFLGRTVPALKFVTAPAEGSVITASFQLDVPYKTANNLIRLTVVISLQRG